MCRLTDKKEKEIIKTYLQIGKKILRPILLWLVGL